MKFIRIESSFVAGLQCHLAFRPSAMALLGALWLWQQAISVVAGPVLFTVDSASSVITESGSITANGVTLPFAEQGTGSLSTHYAGTVLVNLTPPTLQFPGGSLILAITNGSWQPAPGGAAGSAPADSAGKISYSLFFFSLNGYMAGRDIKLDLTSPSLPMTNSGFDGSQLAVTYLTNMPPLATSDFRLTSTIPGISSTNGTITMTGTFNNGPSAAYLTNTAGLLKLVIPVDVTNVSSGMATNDTTMILKGQFVGTAPASAWPLRTTISVTNSLVTLTWPSLAGQNFNVLTSSNLHSWNSATGMTVVNGNTTTWTTTSSRNLQFYRVQMQ